MLTTADGHQVPITVKDLSAGGFRIELDEEVLNDERVELRAGKVPDMIAQINWALGSEAGGVFLEPARHE
jgi:hypothetical protein